MAPHEQESRTAKGGDEVETGGGKTDHFSVNDEPALNAIEAPPAEKDPSLSSVAQVQGDGALEDVANDYNEQGQEARRTNKADAGEEHKETENGTETAAAPPRQFGRRIINLRNRIAERRAAAAAAAKSTPAPKNEESTVAETAMNADYESMRASQISVTVVKVKTEPYGVALTQDPQKKNTVVVDVLANQGLLHESPLKEGDILKTVNNQVVTKYEDVMEQLVGMEGPVTIVVETPQGNPSVVQAFCRKPTKDTRLGVGFQTMEHGDHKLLQINHLDAAGLLADSALSVGDLVLAINGTPCTEKTPEEAATIILESTSTVTIVALNPNRRGGIDPRAQRWMRGAKRAGIAIGGGTMVGVGLIFIPTLPPPFGEVLIAGGVAFLGTEFEAPKRVVRSARDSLERAVGRNETAVEGEGEQGDNNTTTPSEDGEPSELEDNESLSKQSSTAEDGNGESNGEDHGINDCWTQPQSGGDMNDAELEAAVASTLTSRNAKETSEAPKRTMKDRMKRFGRNYVLPFLDQVVGDHKHEEEKEEEEKKEEEEIRQEEKHSTTEEGKE
mmetsp:Transcript_727/g.1155  ORF Transcript_727/g.1155 Transcript_727/m.1155 type:complete len:559 (-) Transcript_727:221-1897(-)